MHEKKKRTQINIIATGAWEDVEPNVIGIIRFRMLEGVKAVLRLYDMRTLISVRDLSRTLFIGTQRSE